MWTWLSTLPPPIWIGTIAIVAVLLIVMAVWGKVNIKIGKNQIGFGSRNTRSCKDCMVLTFSKREEFEVKRRRLENSILKSQMNFAEHKIESVLFGLCQDYREHLKQKRGEAVDNDTEHREYVIYEEIVKQSLSLVKDEVRRSFKENGFHELGGVEFQTYVKNKATDLINRGRSYLLHRYPSVGMVIPVDERIDRMNIGQMEDICFDIYVNAKDVRIKVEQELISIENEFISSIHNILKLKEEQ